jgi:arsenite/tail-anchored protein-transporting ATPase
LAAPRTILYTGKGGVGKTSVAAATARRCAAAGLRTVVLSTDPAHSLSDALEQPLSGDPVAVGDRLWGQEVSAQDEMERNWAGVQEWLGELLIARGVDRISAEELTVPPGMDELFSLLAIKRHHESGDFDVVIVDCAPTGETLRLLSFPDVARWWLDKVFPQQGRILDAARPFARAVLDVSLPGAEVFDDVQRLVRNLIAMNEILRDEEHVSVRLVMTPDRMVVDEARRTFTYLNLYGYLTDAVVVNRVFGAEVGEYFGPWRARQQEQLGAVRDAFAPVPVLQAPYFEEEVVGGAMLDRLGDALFAPAGTGSGTDAHALLHHSISERLELGRDGATLRLDLPFAQRGDLSLKRLGAELIVRVDGHKRTLLLPPALDDLEPTGAAFEDGVLLVTFEHAPPRGGSDGA